MDKKDKLYVALYNDYYGALLTEYQSDLISRYYDMDMSLSEIAQDLGISPQAVRDALVRAQKTLEEYESKLGIARKSADIAALLEKAKTLSGEEKDEAIDAALEILKR